MGRLARKVGLVPSAIYRHFKSKDDVIDAILELIKSKLLGIVEAVRQETPEAMERLRLLLLRHIELIRNNHSLPQVIFSRELFTGRPDRKNRLYSCITTYLKQIEAVIEQGQTDGKIRLDIDASVVSVMFLGLIQPAAILWLMSEGDFDVMRQAEEAWKIFSAALAIPGNAHG